MKVATAYKAGPAAHGYMSMVFALGQPLDGHDFVMVCIAREESAIGADETRVYGCDAEGSIDWEQDLLYRSMRVMTMGAVLEKLGYRIHGLS